ncbi:MAG: DeoR/GlpR transcriptional regulator [Rhizobiales bacterium]|nr:DeoR/GlpR transcriptional regulator [Hyphomicrobiales bacterium]
MEETERQRLIVDLLKDRPFATVKDLLDVLRVSPATIRRDIAKLSKLGAVRKVFGGIASAGAKEQPDRLSARSFEENQMLAVDAKRAIAREAEKLVRDGDAIIIHGGSTCYLFALRFARRNVRIYTNSLPLASRLYQDGDCHLTLAGGEFYREPGIIHSLRPAEPDFYASKFFLGAQGIGPKGIMESHPLIVRETQRLLTLADELVVLADSRKFAVRARYTPVPLSRISTLVTDDGLADADARMLEDAGVRLVVARIQREPSRA